jgi:hypothetical protein
MVLFPMLIAFSAPPSCADSIALRGTQHSMIVKLETELGSPVENATIYFYHEEQNVLLGVSLTNQTGHAVLTWQIPSTHELGPTSLNATFRGDEERHLLPCYILIPLTILGEPVLSVEVSDATGKPIGGTVYPEQVLVFDVRVHDDLKQPLQGVSVRLLGIENQTIAEGTTAQNGDVVFRHRLDPLLVGSILLRLRSLSSGYFSGGELQLHYSVGKSESVFVALPAFLKTGDQSIIFGKLEHRYGDCVPMASIRILLDAFQEIWQSTTDEDGRFSCDLSRVLSKIIVARFLVVSYEGDSCHTPTRAVVGLILAPRVTPFSQLVEVVVPTEAAELLYCIALVAAACTTIGSAYLSLKIKRATSSIVPH